FYNDAYVHVLGLAKHPWALGRPASEVWAEIWDVCDPLARKVFDRGEASFVDDVQLFMSRGDSIEETFYSFSYSPIRDESGGVGGLFCPSTDVTDKVVGARRLHTLSELAANSLVQKSTEAACVTAAQTLGKNADDIPFSLIYLFDGDRFKLQARSSAFDEHGRLQVQLQEAFATGRAQRISLQGLPDVPKGSADRRVTDALALPLTTGAQANPYGVLVAGVNPTCPLDLKYSSFFDLIASSIGTAIQNAHAAEEEQRRLEMLAEMDRAKTTFFSNVSHEFRTPLTLMLGPLEQLSQIEDDRYRPLVQTARRNSLRLLKLVNTLLEFSRLEAGRNDASFAKTDLAALTRDVASSFRSAIESTGLTFEVECDLEEPVYVDRSMWERILLNLLSNALKFTHDGSITITLRSTPAGAQLAVSDTGVGIAEQDLPNLFERFHRIRGAKSRSHEGSGIGLALVHDLAELHGGSVRAESRVGEGTTFYVTVPFGSSHLDASKIVAGESNQYVSAIDQYLADVDATMISPRDTSRAEVGNAPSNAPRILLADDNADLREYVSGILSRHYDVTAVNNGRQALEAAQAGAFDLIVSDVMMPEMDGFEFLQAVRADSRLAGTPFVMLSARAGEESALEGLRSGADDYVVKPFSAEELLARVYAQINAAEIRRRATLDLRASEERFRTLAASMPYIVSESDATGGITFLSDEFKHYTGVDIEAAFGRGWVSFLHPDDVEKTSERWAAAVAAGEPFAGDYRLRRHDGTYRWFTGRAVPMRDGDGNVVRWTATSVDVHDQRNAARERDFLARASEIFSRQLDLETTLAAVARFTVPRIADWCQIDLRTEDGRIKTVAIAHHDPEKDRIAQQFVGRTHLNPEADHGSPFVIRTGQSQILFDVPLEIAAPAIGDDEELRMYAELGMHSVIAVPLTAEGKTLGMLGVLYGDSNRRYTDDDMPMLEELGRRAGLAIHKARLFEREHRAAESFQEASLPAKMPKAPGLALDAFYAPGREEAQVGGDWYDAVRLVDGRIVVSIGDVAGSGLGAAVTMGNMRQIIRGIAQVHADPALMLDAADRALRLEHPDKFVTAFVGVFDTITNTLNYASAGHPPPLLRRPDGTIDTLNAPGLPLGLRSNGTNSGSVSVHLDAGSSLVLYTDGLTEIDRAPDIGERRLRDILAGPAIFDEPRPAKTIADRVTADGAARDDVAVLVVNVIDSAHEPDERRRLQRWQFDTCDMGAASEARGDFARAFRERGADIDDVATAELVFGELVSNTVRYASGHVEVIVDWSGADPVLHVLDNGPGFRHISILPPDLLSESGRGLFIVSALTHDFRVSKRAGRGSHARAVLRLRSRQLVDSETDVYAGSWLHALTDRAGIVSE
ncbi:MAG TPA: SpoIIE family protein phosphatase, partial [Candidatus Baltobacteraceae bacterium]|nr:SpoIIE family protein phosphatase [Candidatus Baltobacteraceae bacterium]